MLKNHPLLSLFARSWWFLCACFIAYAGAAGPGSVSPIEIKLETSNPQPTAGIGLGFMAEVRNGSSDGVILRENFFTLSLPPELEGSFDTAAQGWYARFPTELSQDDRRNIPYGVILLKPGDSYRVFWNYNPPDYQRASDVWGVFQPAVSRIKNEMKFLFFSPGDYKITAQMKYWVLSKGDAAKPLESLATTANYRTILETTTVRVAAPQFVILFGAATGGFIAFLILPVRRASALAGHAKKPQPSKWYWAWLLKAPSFVVRLLGAMLFSAICTILLARVSETQFLIRVTIADIWGATAIGFLANYAGWELIEKIRERSAAVRAPAKTSPNAPPVPLEPAVPDA